VDKAERVLAHLPGAPAASAIVAVGLAGLDNSDGCKQLADTMWNACMN
jgi:hypothetical protein